MATIFTKIIEREIEAVFVYEDELCVVVMDKFPSVAGQTLVIPRQEVNYAFDLSDDLYTHLFLIAKKVAKASDKAFFAERTCLVVEGFEVPHAHIKLYPKAKGDTRTIGEAVEQAKMADDSILEEQASLLQSALD
jgi:histidine triad (HIT) family protein